LKLGLLFPVITFTNCWKVMAEVEPENCINKVRQEQIKSTVEVPNCQIYIWLASSLVEYSHRGGPGSSPGLDMSISGYFIRGWREL
jgi:hypothetical protein